MASELARLRVALIGCGNLGGRIARGIVQGVAGPYELCAVMDRVLPTAQAVASETGATCCSDVHALLDTEPDFVVEAANAEVLQRLARDCIRRAHLVVLSTGAFADDAFLHAITDCANAHRTKIYIASGALGGFDIVQAARLAGTLKVGWRRRNHRAHFRTRPACKVDSYPQPRRRFFSEGPPERPLMRFRKT